MKHPKHRTRSLALLAALAPLAALAVGGGASAQKRVDVKLATLVPEGSVWDKNVRLLGDACRKATDDRVRFKFYSGGVAGDEPDILRKMRIGQLHGGVFTMSGLGDVEPSLRIFEIPLLFHSDEEVFYVLHRMEPTYRRLLEEKGLIVLQWGHAGWLRFFSTEPVRTVDDLKSLKQFVWAGQGNMARWYREAGFRPVPLAATDMLTGLKTGLIESMPSTPLMALSLQWFRTSKYMLDYPVAPLLGATVVSTRIWERISPADQQAILKAAQESEDDLLREIPVQERQAIEEMAKRGLVVTEPVDRGGPGWQAIVDHFAERMSGHLISPALLTEATGYLREFRARDGAQDAHQATNGGSD